MCSCSYVNIIGAKDALALYSKIEKLYLVGDEEILKQECKKHQLNDPRVEIIHSPEGV